MRVNLRDESAQKMFRAATLRWKLQIKLSTSLCHSILTPGQPVPALSLHRQAPGRSRAGEARFEGRFHWSSCISDERNVVFL